MELVNNKLTKLYEFKDMEVWEKFEVESEFTVKYRWKEYVMIKLKNGKQFFKDRFK